MYRCHLYIRLRNIADRVLILWSDAEKEFTGAGLDLAVLEGNSLCLEAGLDNPAKPVMATEHAEYMPVVFTAYIPAFSQEVGEVDDIGGIGRVGVPGPLKVTHTPFLRVVPTVTCSGVKGLAGAVGGKQGHTTGTAVYKRSFEGTAEVIPGSHIHDCVMDKYGIELSVKPDRSHVSLDVLTLRIELAAHSQHARRAVHQGQPVMRL